MSGRIAIRPARADDDPSLKALLRELPFAGTLRLTLEREPSFFTAAAVEGSPHHAFVGDAGDGRLAGLFTRAVRPVWLDGEPARLGYLGQLRKAPGVALSRRHLRKGFAACESTRTAGELPFDLTSIVADNAPARKLLERGLPGLPVYRPWTELVTVAIPAARRPRPLPAGIRRADADLLPVVARHLARELSQRQLAPVWELHDLGRHCPGLTAGDFLVATEADRGAPRVTGCLALWDQRSFKQTVVRGYAPWLARLRPLLSPALRLAGRPALPPPGRPLAMAFLSHEAVPRDHPEGLLALVEGARRLATGRGIELVVLGLTRDDPRLRFLLRRLPARTYDSILYLVHPRTSEALRSAVAAASSSRPPHAEVSLL